MYSASATFNTLIKAKERTFTYSGSIVTTGGTTYTFSGSDMRSGKLVRSIANDSIEIGSVYASEFDCELSLNVSRYELYNGTITLNIEIEGASDVIPMGIFTISEINQTADRLQIKSYDNMIKFDSVSFSKPTDIKLPFTWLSDICSACGVTLGNSSAQIAAMPNGNRKTGFADVVTDIKTMRDVLGDLATYLGGYAYIGRNGYLYIGHYGSVSVDTIPASFRYSSGLSDFRTTYDGLYAVYKNDGVQEYVANTNSGGIVLDIGTNPFLQFSNSTNRQAALQKIIDAFDGIYYVPYESEIPMNPLYDVGDVLQFTGNQADSYDYGAITDIVLTIGGAMRITCSGDNPRLAEAQDRFTKTIEGLSSEYSNGQEVGTKEFWLLFNHNTEEMTVDSTETLVTEIEFEQKTFAQNIEMILTLDGEVSTSSEINVRVVVDDDTDLQMSVTESRTMKGEREFHCSNPQKIYGEGTHICKVYMTVTDSPILWSDFE